MGAWLPSASSFLCMAFPDGELAQTLPSPNGPGAARMGGFSAIPQEWQAHPADPNRQIKQNFWLAAVFGVYSWHCLPCTAAPQGLCTPWRMQGHERLATLSKPTDQTPAINKLGCHTFLTPKKGTGKGPVSHQILPLPPNPPPLSILSNTNTSSDTPAHEIAEPIPLPNGPLLLRLFLSLNLHNPFFLKFQVITPCNATLSPCKQPSPFPINHYKLIFRKKVSLKLLQPFH